MAPGARADRGGLPRESFARYAPKDDGRRRQRHPVLRSQRSGERWLDRRQIEFEGLGVHRIGRIGIAPEALFLGVGLDQGDPFGIAAGETEIIDGRPADREEAAGGAVLGSHVGDRRLIGEGQVIDPRAEELDELADDPLLAQHFRHRQDEVGRRRPLLHGAGQPEADHLRDQHRDRLAEHRRLCLDAADAPAEDGQAVDHRRVAVGPDEGIGIGDRAVARRPVQTTLRQILEVDLMADAGPGRNDAEIVECGLTPAQEPVALLVALELFFSTLYPNAPAMPNPSTSRSGR